MPHRATTRAQHEPPRRPPWRGRSRPPRARESMVALSELVGAADEWMVRGRSDAEWSRVRGVHRIGICAREHVRAKAWRSTGERVLRQEATPAQPRSWLVAPENAR